MLPSGMTVTPTKLDPERLRRTVVGWKPIAAALAVGVVCLAPFRSLRTMAYNILERPLMLRLPG